jgi:hypothetical protein
VRLDSTGSREKIHFAVKDRLTPLVEAAK